MQSIVPCGNMRREGVSGQKHLRKSSRGKGQSERSAQPGYYNTQYSMSEREKKTKHSLNQKIRNLAASGDVAQRVFDRVDEPTVKKHFFVAWPPVDDVSSSVTKLNWNRAPLQAAMSDQMI